MRHNRRHNREQHPYDVAVDERLAPVDEFEIRDVDGGTAKPEASPCENRGPQPRAKAESTDLLQFLFQIV